MGTFRNTLILTIAFMLYCSFALAAEEPIGAVSVHLTTDGAQIVPPNTAKRMNKSVSAIGEQLLIGHKAAEVAANHEAYEKLIKEVFDRVLLGYSVEAVQVAPNGQIADIWLKLALWGDTVHEAALEVDYGGASAEVAQLIKQDMGNVQESIDEALVGLPVDAVEWAGSAAKSVIREQLEARLPEFRYSIDIVPGIRTVVKLTLSPTSPVVQNVHVALRSHTIPNLLLEQIRPELEAAVTGFTGLPAQFIDRHRAYFTNRLTELTARHTLAKRYGIVFTPSINAAAETEVAFKADTSLYNLTLDGYLDVGRRTDNNSLKLHMGKNFSNKTEAFLETTFLPGSVTWKFMPGMVYRYDYTAAGFKYDITNEHYILLFNQYLGNHWSARFERTPADGSYEFGLRYKLHEFVSLEYIFTNNDHWLRLIGNL